MNGYGPGGEPLERVSLYQVYAPARISIKEALKMANSVIEVADLLPKWRFDEQQRDSAARRRLRLKAQERLKEHNANT